MIIGGAYYYNTQKDANDKTDDKTDANDKTDDKKDEPAATLTPIDCNVSEWSKWGDCSKACGGGTQERTRTVKTAAANGGTECGALSESQTCNEQACPPEYVITPEDNTLSCPDGYSPIMDIDKCKKIYSNYRDTFHEETNASYPSGCYGYSNNYVYFNTYANNSDGGNPHPEAQRICELAK